MRAPEDASLRAALGFGYQKVGRLEEAVAAYGHAVRLGLRDPDVELKQAQILEQLRKWEEAAAIYARIGDQNPDHPTAGRKAANAFMQLGRHRDAIPLLQQAILGNDDAQVRFDLGVCYANLNNKEAAMMQYKALVAKDADLAEQLLFVIES